MKKQSGDLCLPAHIAPVPVQKKAHMKKQSKLVPFFFARRRQFCRQNDPRFGVKKRTQKWSPFIQSQFDCLCPGDLAPVLGSVFGPQNGGRFVGKIFAAGRKIVQVLIVSAGTRQMVLHAAGFPWFCSAASNCSPRPANMYVRACS